MLFAILDPFQVFTMDEIRRRHPNVSFPVNPTIYDVQQFGYTYVSIDPYPAIDWKQRFEKGGYVIEGNSVRQTWNVIDLSPEEIQQAISDARLGVKDQLRLEYSQLRDNLENRFTGYDPATWPLMRHEARAWLRAPDDAKPETPFITAIHAARLAMGDSITLAELVSFIISQDAEITPVMAHLTAVRQITEARILQENTPQDIYAITWTFDQ
ncbi:MULTISPECIES: hypothetical protein [unclassified Pseudomonas]|uniref:hypothetical protein n=1 Tax=unclassified Pseudomonas TaxID=196821 RepID=UPI001C610B58|nr:MULTISPECIES: hypothetical protein [unclassified Pseudomonas]MBW5416099.1 hypothetical protein [Pseudomonas sp. MAG002Y]